MSDVLLGYVNYEPVYGPVPDGYQGGTNKLGPDRRDRGARFIPDASASSASDKTPIGSSGPSSAAHTAPPGDLSRSVVRARNELAPFGGDEITEAIILLDRWLARQDESTKRRLAAYFGWDGLPVSALPKGGKS